MRRKKTRKQKQDEFKRRYDAVKNLMSTFAMSTVAVVAVVTLVPASPQAEIIKTVALSEEIVYQVNVTDEDNALDESTLFVVLENQLEYYEQPISLGENSGYFDNLEDDTQYWLSVYGNKGFGQERLDTELITTREQIGGTILSVTPDIQDHNTNYYVDVSIYDPDLKYSSINLYYGYTWEPGEELTYYEVPINSSRETLELMDIWTDYPFHIYLEGTTIDGNEVLDEIWVTPPYTFNADVYLAYLNNEELKFHVYGDMGVDNLKYNFNIYRGNMLLRTEEYIPEPDDYHGGYLIEDLLPDTTYVIEVEAVFTNPQTLSREAIIIYNEEHTTIKDYSYDHTITWFDTYIEITVNLNDPFDLFQVAYYETYDTTGDHEMWIEGNVYPFEVNGEDKTITFTFDIPIVESYTIYILMNNQTDNTIIQNIETINSD